MHLVLHVGEKSLRFHLVLAIVVSQGEDFPNTLVNACFTSANFPDTGQ